MNSMYASGGSLASYLECFGGVAMQSVACDDLFICI